MFVAYLHVKKLNTAVTFEMINDLTHLAMKIEAIFSKNEWEAYKK